MLELTGEIGQIAHQLSATIMFLQLVLIVSGLSLSAFTHQVDRMNIGMAIPSAA